jgi:RES domain-containing protein
VPETGAARAIGDAWLDTRAVLALQVPSIHSRSEWNVLVNREHRAFRRVAIDAPVPFAFDLRPVHRPRR